MTYSDGNAPSALSESIYGKSDRAATLAPKKENETTSDTQSASTISLGTSQSNNVQNYPETQAYMTHSVQGSAPSFFNMGDVRSILPGSQSQSIPYEQHPMQQPLVSTIHPHGVVYAMHPFTSFPGPPMNVNMSFNTPFHQVYASYPQQHHHENPLSRGPAGYQTLVPHPSSHLNVHTAGRVAGYGYNCYPQSTYMAALGHGQGPPATSSSHLEPRVQSGSTQSSNAKTSSPAKEQKERNPDIEYDVSKTIVDGSTPMRPAPVQTPFSAGSNSYTFHTITSNTPRGPPRKPKQSGNALWVGNLPPGTNIVDLKDYFSEDATKDLESVFLISKSNCAFINYKTATSCATAMSKFNDSRFHGARLVCRLRQGTVSPVPNSDYISSYASLSLQDNEAKLQNSGSEKKDADSRLSPNRVPSKYFIVKSLTVGDLEFSRQSNIWATQIHNEDQLNQAYETADNVFLIFSANKSGEYYGYARMMSPIQDDASLTLEMPPRLDNIREPEPLDVTPAPATSTAPSGRIINDSARGTVFWEAESSEEESGASKKSITNEKVQGPTDMEAQLIGKPFRIQWLSTTRVPFHRTRGLRNPWNSNREVKIARDGTEIEPEVGWKLIQLFHSQPQD